jgi:hypothetical protein
MESAVRDLYEVVNEFVEHMPHTTYIVVSITMQKMRENDKEYYAAQSGAKWK